MLSFHHRQSLAYSSNYVTVCFSRLLQMVGRSSKPKGNIDLLSHDTIVYLPSWLCVLFSMNKVPIPKVTLSNEWIIDHNNVMWLLLTLRNLITIQATYAGRFRCSGTEEEMTKITFRYYSSTLISLWGSSTYKQRDLFTNPSFWRSVYERLNTVVI